MKSTKTYAMLLILSLFLANSLNAQHGHFRPDSLTSVTISGKVTVKTQTFQDTLKHKDTVVVRQITRYLLDTDSNGSAEYELNFGPSWYKPDSSDAVRPADGDLVTITGGQSSRLTKDSLKMVLVYEINGKFWRNPLEATWNKMGVHSNDKDHGGKGPKGYGFGFMHDTLKTVTVSGKAIVDTTFINEQFFLDTNNDTTADYRLNFGPYWYQPTSGAVRPKDGDDVVIVGGLLEHGSKPMIIVYSINGNVWFDSTTIGKDLGGSWIKKDNRQASKCYSPFDAKTWMSVNSGFMGGSMMKNDLYGQILELVPGDVPNQGNEKVLAAYEISLFDQSGDNAMLQNGIRGNHMDLGTTAQLQLHFTDTQLALGNFTENTVVAKCWDNKTNSWVAVSNASLSTATNTVSFQQQTVSNLVILTAAKSATTAESQDAKVVDSYQLSQNYPNPFNPSTVINYTLAKTGFVTLKIYNILGKEVATLVSGNQIQGAYSVQFNAANLPSGMYIYELRSDNFSMSKKMLLLK